MPQGSEKVERGLTACGYALGKADYSSGNNLLSREHIDDARFYVTILVAHRYFADREPLRFGQVCRWSGILKRG